MPAIGIAGRIVNPRPTNWPRKEWNEIAAALLENDRRWPSIAIVRRRVMPRAHRRTVCGLCPPQVGHFVPVPGQTASATTNGEPDTIHDGAKESTALDSSSLD